MFDGDGGTPSKEQLERVFEGCAIGLCLSDPEGRMFPNRPFCEMLGYGQNELTGRSWREVTHPEDLRPGEEAMLAIIAGVLSHSRFSKRYLHKSGATVWGEVSTRLHRDANGAPVFFITSILDYTERKALERELVLRNTILATEHEALPDGILVVGSDAKVLSHNRRFLEICGIPKEAIGSGDDRVLLQAAAAQMLEPEKFLERVAWLYSNPLATSRDDIDLKNGRTVERLSAPMISQRGENLGRVWFFRDISESKRAEHALRERLDELERWQDVMLDREERISALKYEVNDLRARLGEPPRYSSQEAGEGDIADHNSRTTLELARFMDPMDGVGERK